MDFGKALTGMKEGKLYTRTGWNGKGMWVRLTPKPYLIAEGPGARGIRNSRMFFELKAADGTIGPWTASATDMTAEDWEEVTFG